MAFTIQEVITLRGPGNLVELRYNEVIRSVRVLYAPQEFTICGGHGQSEPILFVRAGDRCDVQLMVPENVLTITWGTSPALPDANYAKPIIEISSEEIFSGAAMATPILLAQTDSLGQIRGFHPWGNSSSLTDIPAMRALVDIGSGPFAVTPSPNPWPVDVSAFSFGGGILPVSVSGGPLPVTPFASVTAQTYRTYGTVARRTARSYLSSLVFAAAGRLPLMTLWIPGVAGSAFVHSIDVLLADATAACEVWFDLVRTDTQPTAGTALSPNRVDTNVTGGTIVEFKLTPTIGTEVGTATESVFYNPGVTGAVSTINPAPPVPWQPLYRHEDEFIQSKYRIDHGHGLMVMVDCSAAATVRVAAQMQWTEYP